MLPRRTDFSVEFVRETHLLVDQGSMAHCLKELRKAGMS